MYSYVLLFLCLYLLQHPAWFLIRSLVLARDDGIVGMCAKWVLQGKTQSVALLVKRRRCLLGKMLRKVIVFVFRHKNIRTKGYIERSNVCSSKLDILLSFQCLHLR